MSWALLFSAGAAALLLLRRRAKTHPAPLHVSARVGLSQRAGLAIVELDGARLLIGYGDGAPRLLERLTLSSPDPEESPNAPA